VRMQQLPRVDWSNRQASFDADQLAALREIWRVHGYVFLRSTDLSRAFVARAARLPTTSLPGNAQVQISGMVEQFDQDRRGADFDAEFGADWDHFVRRLASEVTGEETMGRYYVKAHKILQVKPGSGEQAVHLDLDDEHLGAVCSVVLYCSSGVSSTAFPATFAARDFATNDDAASMRATVDAGWLDKSAYHSVRVEAGDVAIFRQTTPHYGTRNDTNAPRTVLFSILTPFNGPEQDEFQVFRWMYIKRAYGTQSRQFAQALHDDWEHRPLEQYDTRTKNGRAALIAARKSLQRWGFSDGTTKPKPEKPRSAKKSQKQEHSNVRYKKPRLATEQL
jgi:hypothetical protein